jgi:hypothetical protein
MSVMCVAHLHRWGPAQSMPGKPGRGGELRICLRAGCPASMARYQMAKGWVRTVVCQDKACYDAAPHAVHRPATEILDFTPREELARWQAQGALRCR